MKKIVGFMVMLISALAYPSSAQNKIDNERMDRDIEVAENALATMVRQQFGKGKYFGMGMDIKGNYTPGYGVTLRLPGENNFIYSVGGDLRGAAVISGSGGEGVTIYRPGDAPVVVDARKATAKDKEARAGRQDSAREAYYKRVIQASKDFLADYGDLLSQLAPEEKILITNRGEGYRYYYWDKNSNNKRTLMTIEATKGDIVSFKQGKLNRDQMMSKIKVVNTESTNEVDTDLELLSSIMNRLYRSDLAKTYYVDEGIYYERLKDFGVIYYMSTVSSIEQDVQYGEGKRLRMPTQNLQDLDQAQRDKKVTELYPAFEKELRDNIIEYARTVKSLGPEEMVVFNVRITKCEKCGIPSNLELSVKNNVLKQYSEGKITRDAAASQINVKKGPAQ